MTTDTRTDAARWRAAALARELVELDGQLQAGGADDVGTDRFLLIQRNYRYGRGYWTTTWPDPARAGDYIVGEEYAEDWETVALVDLDTGDRFDAVTTVSWRPA